jgi:hypothetical protein
MDIRLVGGVDDVSPQKPNRGSFANGNQRSGFRNNNNQQNGTRGRSRGGGKQNGFGKKEDVTAEDLDAELEAYRAESAPKK